LATLFKPKKRNTFYISYFLDGKRTTRNTKILAIKENRKKANELLRDIEYELRNHHRPATSVAQGNSTSDDNITIEEGIKRYAGIHLSHRSKGHQENFRAAMSHFLALNYGKFPIQSITSHHMSEYIATIANKVSVTSQRTYLAYMKGFFNFMCDEGIIAKSPLNRKLIPRPENKTIITFEPEMLENILNEAKSKDHTFYKILVLLSGTGLRPCDLLALKAGDIDLNRNVMHVKISKTSREILFPLYQDLRELMVEYFPNLQNMPSDHKLFESYNVSMLGKRFRRLKAKLGITDRYAFTLKTFRKTFATSLIDKDVDSMKVADLLGHTSVNTTRKFYVNKRAETIREKLNQLDIKVMR
jgi:integrase